jgi:segregation and condensation protein B
MRLTQIIEALLFASDAPLTAADLARVDERLDEDTVTAVVEELRAEYDLAERSFQIYEVAGGFQLLTRPEFVAVLERYDTVPHASRLSTPALEVLAIIAYRQPIGRTEIEEIRGVQSAAVLRTLQDRSLVEPVGRSEALGRPLLYGTTSKFLEHFGFRSLEELPRPDELPVVLKTRPAVPVEAVAPPPAPDGEAAAEGDAGNVPAEATEEAPQVVEASAAAAEPSANAAEPTANVAELTANAAEPTAHAAEPTADDDSAERVNADAEPVHGGAAAEQMIAAAEALDADPADNAQVEEAGDGLEPDLVDGADVEDAAAAGLREG